MVLSCQPEPCCRFFFVLGFSLPRIRPFPPPMVSFVFGFSESWMPQIAMKTGQSSACNKFFFSHELFLFASVFLFDVLFIRRFDFWAGGVVVSQNEGMRYCSIPIDPHLRPIELCVVHNVLPIIRITDFLSSAGPLSCPLWSLQPWAYMVSVDCQAWFFVW